LLGIQDAVLGTEDQPRPTGGFRSETYRSLAGEGCASLSFTHPSRTTRAVPAGRVAALALRPGVTRAARSAPGTGRHREPAGSASVNMISSSWSPVVPSAFAHCSAISSHIAYSRSSRPPRSRTHPESSRVPSATTGVSPPPDLRATTGGTLPTSSRAARTTEGRHWDRALGGGSDDESSRQRLARLPPKPRPTSAAPRCPSELRSRSALL